MNGQEAGLGGPGDIPAPLPALAPPLLILPEEPLLIPEEALLPYIEEDILRLSKEQLDSIPDPWAARAGGQKNAATTPAEDDLDDLPYPVTDIALTMKAAAWRITLPRSLENEVDMDDRDDDKFLDTIEVDHNQVERETLRRNRSKKTDEAKEETEMISSPKRSSLLPSHTVGSAYFNLTLLSSKSDMSRFNWAPLFAHMQLRKIERKIHGYSVDQNHNLPAILLTVVILLLFSFFWITSKFESVELSQSLGFNIWAWCLLGIVMLPGLIVVRFHVPPVLELCWLWLALGFIFSLFVALDYAFKYGYSLMPGGVCFDPDHNEPPDTPECNSFVDFIYERYLDGRWGLTIAFACIIFLTLLLFAVRNRILPWSLKRHRNSKEYLTWMFSIRIVGNAPEGTFTISYRLPFPWSWARRRYNFRYRGSISQEGLASGFGRVSDSASTGELLEGWFEDGVPVAPFRSSEKGHFNAWEGLRIGIAGATWNNWKRTGLKSDSEGLSWGVATTECTVAGRFFRNLPVRKLLLPRLVPPDTQTYLRDILLPTLSAGVPNIDVNRHAREAVIYVHGFKQSIASATTKLAQLAGLAALPNVNFAFWCFDWPSGTTFSFNRTRVESGSAETEKRFGEFLKNLVDAGCRKVHLIGHSMGARVATNLARDGGKGLSAIFKRCDGVEGPDDEDKAELSSVIMINPEVLLDDFVINRFPGLRRYCSSITIYADRNDSALYTAETVGNGLTLGRNPHIIMCKDAQGRPRYLDLDCIDNTHLESNVGAVRHSYFAINTMMVDDFQDVVMENLKRAEERPKLRRRAGNVWGFLVAPKAVTK